MRSVEISRTKLFRNIEGLFNNFVWVKEIKPYLKGYKFVVITEHLSLKWPNTIDNPSGRIVRWVLELQQYDFTVESRKIAKNVAADAPVLVQIID